MPSPIARAALAALCSTVVVAAGCDAFAGGEGGEGEGEEGEGERGEGEGEEGEGEGEEGEGEEGEGEEGEGEGEEGEGEGEDPLGGLRINEVSCEGVDRVELVNVGDVDVDLGAFLLTDNLQNLRDATALSGPLGPGAFLDVDPDFGIACGEAVHLIGTTGIRTPLATVTTPIDVLGGSFGRLPDGVGAFALNTPTPGASNVAYTDPAAPIFAPLAAPLRFDLTITPAAEATLRSGSFEYVEADLTVSGNGINDGPLHIGVRKKGKVGSRRNFDQKMAWKFDFDRFVVDQEYRRLRKLNLNNMVQDRSTIHEQMAYRVLAEAGLPTPRQGNATLFVNGVEFGTYLLLEAFDDPRYLERDLPETVSLFEGGLTEAACCDFTDILPNEIARFEFDAGDEAFGRAEIAELSQRLNGAAASDVFASLDPIVDWDQVLATMAVEATIGHWDGYQVSPNNFYLHLGDDERWRMIAAGVDQTFAREGRVNTVYNGAGQLFRRCREDPVCSARYNAQLEAAIARGEALLAGGWSDEIGALVDHHLATFSRARLEESPDAFATMPARKDAAFSYFVERLRALRQALACDGLPGGTACTVDFGGGDVLAGSCGSFSDGFGCR